MIVEGIVKFYRIKLFSPDENEQNNIHWLIQRLYSPSNLYNFSLCLMFESPKLSEICFELQKQFDKKMDSNIEQHLAIMEKFQEKPPQEFGVALHFCLNEKSIEFMFKELDFDCDLDQIENQTTTTRRYSIHEVQPQPMDYLGTTDTNHHCLLTNSQRSNSQMFSTQKLPIKADNLSILNSERKSQVNQIRLTSPMNKYSDNQKQIQVLLNRVSQPYESAINLMKKIDYLKSPMHKLLLLQRVGQEILNCIFQFYQAIQLEQSFELSSQDMIFIFLYILIKANVNSLHSHFNLIENFINSDDLQSNKSSMFSYFTVRSCLDYIDGLQNNNNDEQSIIHLI